jgi:CRISPR-associated protein Cas1
MRNAYYSAYNYILKNGFAFERREKRPPTDPVNALISFGNSMMYTTVLGEIYKTQLDPTISFLHEPSTKRFSLCLDIAEIFKPLVVDPLIFYLINNKMITMDDFNIQEDVCFLNDKGRKKFIKEYETKLSTTIRHRSLNRNVSYRNFIKLECYKLIKYFIDDEVYKPLKAWW